MLGGTNLARDRVQSRAFVSVVFELSSSATRGFLNHSLVVRQDKISHGSFLS